MVRRERRRGAVVAFAAVFAAVVCGFMLYHSFVRATVVAGQRSRSGGSDEGALPSSPKPHVSLTLTPLTDYIADYRIENVSQRPPVFVGTAQHPLKFHYMDVGFTKRPFRWLSERPRVAYVPDFVSDDECDTLIREASAHLDHSMVEGVGMDPARTSAQAWLPVSHGIGHQLEKYAADMIHFPLGACERVQVLRYGPGQFYRAHYDYFDPQAYGPQATNRAITVFVYLSDVEGGHTWFPNADTKAQLEESDFTSCQRGLRFRPKKRSAIVFYNMLPDGALDEYSLHGGCPVTSGVKWAATLWFRVSTD